MLQQLPVRNDRISNWMTTAAPAEEPSSAPSTSKPTSVQPTQDSEPREAERLDDLIQDPGPIEIYQKAVATTSEFQRPVQDDDGASIGFSEGASDVLQDHREGHGGAPTSMNTHCFFSNDILTQPYHVHL